MAQEKKDELVEVYTKSERFFEENKNLVYGVVGAIALLIAGFTYFKANLQPEWEAAATEDMYMAEIWFSQDSFALALNGNGLNKGFNYIIDEYNMKFVPQTNLAHYYAGVCNLRLGEFNKAIDHFKAYNKKEELTGAMAYAGMGDAYMELGDRKNGIKFYKKAVSSTDNDVTAPWIMLKTGMALELENKPGEALGYYQDIKDDYPTSVEGLNIDKYIARAEAKSK